MNESENCPTPQEHKAHMCQLKAEGRIEEIDKASKNPSHICNRCGAKADAADYLCQPRPL